MLNLVHSKLYTELCVYICIHVFFCKIPKCLLVSQLEENIFKRDIKTSQVEKNLLVLGFNVSLPRLLSDFHPNIYNPPFENTFLISPFSYLMINDNFPSIYTIKPKVWTHSNVQGNSQSISNLLCKAHLLLFLAMYQISLAPKPTNFFLTCLHFCSWCGLC